MKRILVPTDFSECANKAINYAVQLSKFLQVKVTLLHSFEVKGNVYTDYMGVNREFNESMLNEAEEQLTKVKMNVKDKEHVDLETTLSTDSLIIALNKLVEEKKADIVVMGTLGASGFKEKIWGSKTAHFIGISNVPVIVIPQAYEWKKPAKILFTTNHFEKKAFILDFLFELANVFLAQIVVTVFTDVDDDKTTTYVEHKLKMGQYEKYLKEIYNEYALTTSNIYGKHFEETLQNYIEEKSIDILVMVAYQHSFWESIFKPSKSKRMSYHTDIPLLVIPDVNM